MKFRRKNNGFTMIELLYSLLITGTITLIGYQVANDVFTKNRLNSDIDSIISNENIATKFVMDKNKTIVNLMKTNSLDYYAVPMYNLKTLVPDYNLMYSSKLVPSVFSDPCLIITRDSSNEVIKGYIFWNNNSTNKSNYPLSNIKYISSKKIEVEIVSNNSQSLLNKTNISNPSSSTILNAIQNNDISGLRGCNLQVKDNSIFLDLSKNSNFNFVRDLTTDKSGNVDTSKTSEALTSLESSANSSNQTLSTNLYFDSIVKESAPYTNYYCDNSMATKQFGLDIKNQCIAYEQATGNFFDGRERITGSNSLGKTCEYMVSGTFSGRTEAVWVADTSITELINHGSSYINVGCKWVSSNTSIIDQTKVTQYCVIGPNYADQLYPNRSCKFWVAYSCYVDGSYKDFTACEDDSNRVTMLQQQGCRFVSRGANGMSVPGETNCSAASLAHGGLNVYGDTIICKIGGNTSHEDSCGKITKDAFIDQGITPPVHKFQALNIGNKASISSATPNGGSISTDANIRVANAGVKSGYIFIRSKNIVADSSCVPEDLGKIYQQTDIKDKFLGSQLICTYDPDFCGGSGYCYSPLVSELQVVAGNGAKTLYCPAGTRIDTSVSILDQSGVVFSSTCLNFQKDGNKVNGVEIYQNLCPNRSIKEIRCVNSGMIKEYKGCTGGINGEVNCNGDKK